MAGLPRRVLERFAGMTSTVLYLHLDQTSGTWSEERGGALSRRDAEAIVGHSRVTVRPVLDTATELTYTGYVAPPRLREQLALRNGGYCSFPECSRRARVGDVDHQEPWPRGFVDPAEQAAETGAGTTSSNTHLLCRKHHRAKTHGGWQVQMPAPGVYAWRSPAGACWLVTEGATVELTGIFDHDHGHEGAVPTRRPEPWDPLEPWQVAGLTTAEVTTAFAETA